MNEQTKLKLPSTLKNGEKFSEKGYYCYGKKDFCHEAYIGRPCGACEHYNGAGGEIRELLINKNKSNNFDVKSNNEIEEMKRDLKSACISQYNQKKCTNFESCKDCQADFLYNAGYRKQSEGEWIENRGVCSQPYCSVCGAIGNKGNYCSHCGAKMKGGEE